MYFSANQIKQRIGPQLVPYWNSVRNYAGFSDENYWIWTETQIKQYVAAFPIHGNPNLGEGFDCDDYTYVLKGSIAIYNRDIYGAKATIGVGIAWGYFSWVPLVNGKQVLHATNWFMDPSGIFHWVEPQDQTVYSLNKCTPGSLTLLLL